MSDAYNEYPSYPVAPCDGTGYYPQDGQYHNPNPPYEYQEQYAQESPQGYHYPTQYGPDQQAPTYQVHPPTMQGLGATYQGTEPFDPSAGTLHPGTETGQLEPYEPRSPGENLSYYAPAQNEHRHSRSPSPMAPLDSSPTPNPNQTPQPQPREGRGTDPNGEEEGERGLGGTLVGGATGYYVGHKKDHGFLGAVGGALLGNYVEDKVKEERDDHRHGSRHGHHHHGHHHGRHHHHHHHGHRSHSGHSSSGGSWC